MVVEVVGTLFAVEVRGDATCVVVAHGRVRATSGARTVATGGGRAGAATHRRSCRSHRRRATGSPITRRRSSTSRRSRHRHRRPCQLRRSCQRRRRPRARRRQRSHRSHSPRPPRPPRHRRRPSRSSRVRALPPSRASQGRAAGSSRVGTAANPSAAARRHRARPGARARAAAHRVRAADTAAAGPDGAAAGPDGAAAGPDPSAGREACTRTSPGADRRRALPPRRAGPRAPRSRRRRSRARRVDRQFPSAPILDQARYERARIAYQRHAWSQAQRELDRLAELTTPLAEPGAYLSCRIAVEAHDERAQTCLTDYRRTYPQSPHALDVLGLLVELAAREGGCSRAAPLVVELARGYPHSALARAWRDRCKEAP